MPCSKRAARGTGKGSRSAAMYTARIARFLSVQIVGLRCSWITTPLNGVARSSRPGLAAPTASPGRLNSKPYALRRQALLPPLAFFIPLVSAAVGRLCFYLTNFKRGVVGTLHKVSAKYMSLYVAEFQFRYNNRKNADIFGAAVAQKTKTVRPMRTFPNG
jgi:hypothetical protein